MPAPSTKKVKAPSTKRPKKTTAKKKPPPPLIEGENVNLYCVQGTCWLKVPKSAVSFKKNKNGTYLAQGDSGGKKGCRFICESAYVSLK